MASLDGEYGNLCIPRRVWSALPWARFGAGPRAVKSQKYALYKAAMVYIPSHTYLESSAHAENAVVGLPL